MEELQADLVKQKSRLKDVWTSNCSQLAKFDNVLTEKEKEIQSLKTRLGDAVSSGT